MLEQKDLAKLEIQGVASGTTLEELITLSVAVEGAIRILDARSKQIAEELKNLLAKQKALKKNVFEDAPEEDDADIINNNSGGGSSEDKKVLADPTDSTPATLSEKLAVDKSASDLLSFVVTQKTPEDNTLSLTAAGAAPNGIVLTETRYDEENNEYTALSVHQPQQDGVLVYKNGVLYELTDVTEYIDTSVLLYNIAGSFTTNSILFINGDGAFDSSSDYKDILDTLQSLVTSGGDGFLRMRSGVLELVESASCDDSSNGDTWE